MLVLAFTARAPVVRRTSPAPDAVSVVMAAAPLMLLICTLSTAFRVNVSTPFAVRLSRTIQLVAVCPSSMVSCRVSSWPTVAASLTFSVRLVVCVPLMVTGALALRLLTVRLVPAATLRSVRPVSAVKSMSLPVPVISSVSKPVILALFPALMTVAVDSLMARVSLPDPPLSRPELSTTLPRFTRSFPEEPVTLCVPVARVTSSAPAPLALIARMSASSVSLVLPTPSTVIAAPAAMSTAPSVRSFWLVMVNVSAALMARPLMVVAFTSLLMTAASTPAMVSGPMVEPLRASVAV